MWIGYTPPSPFAWTISGGTFVGDSDGSHLTDGQPRSLTRFQWPSGAQTTSTTVALRATFPSAPMPDIGCLLNTTLPVGTKIDIKCRLDGGAVFTTALSGNATGSRTIRRADGTIALAWGFERVYKFPSAPDVAFDTNITGIELTIYNDVNGTASIAASTQFDIGELFVSPASYLQLRRELSSETVNRDRKRAVDNTMLTNPRYTADARTETYSIRTTDWSDVGNDSDKLRGILADAKNADRVLFIPRWHLPGVNAGVPWSGSSYLDVPTMNASALFGVVSSLGAISLAESMAWDTSVVASEAT